MKNLTFKTLMATLIIIGLSACSNSDSEDDMENQMFRIKITNLTNSQPLSPAVAMLHDDSMSFWQIGMMASVALEKMAEGGDGSELLLAHSGSFQHAETEVLLPGGSTEFTLEMSGAMDSLLSVAGMLVNTNDAFSGVNAVRLENLEAGQSMVYLTRVYDAGTELNSEQAGTIPGPADETAGGGFDATRDDVTSVVTLHSGIVGEQDGFTESTLSESDKFDNPALRIEVFAL